MYVIKLSESRSIVFVLAILLVLWLTFPVITLSYASTGDSKYFLLSPPPRNSSVGLDNYLLGPGLDVIPSPISGFLKVLVIPTEFSNYGNLTSINQVVDKVVLMDGYYGEVSYSNIDLQIWYLTDWITLPNTREYYGMDSSGIIDVNIDQYIFDSLDIVDPSVNLSEYDYIILVHAGYDQASSGDPDDIWSRATLGKVYLPGYDGGIVVGISILAETDPYGVFAHEFGHNLELPDLYDATYTKEFVGRWSLMASGSWLSPPSSIMAVEKKWLGWLSTLDVLRVPRDEYRIVQLSPLDQSTGIRMIEIPLGAIYYTVEYRRKVGTDSSLPDSGVIISRVDESRGSGEGPIIVVDRNPSTSSKSDAAFKQGMIYINKSADFYVKILSLTSTGAKIYVQNGIPNLYIAGYNYTRNNSVYTFSVTIGNSGGAAPNVSVSMYVDGVLTSIWSAGFDLAKGDTVNVVFPPVTLSVGNHSVTFVVDDGNKIIERNETDNLLNVYVGVTPLYVLDNFQVSDPRADVGSVQIISIHFSDYSTQLDYGNKIVYINNTGYITNSTGWIQLIVSSNNVGRIVYMLTDPLGVQLVIPQIIFDKVIVDLQVSDPDGRVDVGSTAPIYVVARYAYDGLPFNGTVEFNQDLNMSVVGRFTYTVIGISDNLYGLTVFVSNSVDVIFDRVVIIVEYDDRVNVGDNPIINITAYYEYDGVDFIGNILFNDTFVKDSVGRYGFRVIGIEDALYGLNVFLANDFSIIFDKVMILLSPSNQRVDVGSEASISITAFYLYDGSDYNGFILLNDSLTKDSVGIYGYRVAEIGNDTYGITVFESNEISIIFDRVVINLYAVDYRVNVGDTARIGWNAYYEFDGAIFNGSIMLNGSLTQDTVGKYYYSVESLLDPDYGLTVFISNVVEVIFDRVKIELKVVDDRIDVGSEADILISAWYEYDLAEYDGDILLNDTLRKDEVGKYFYSVLRIGNDTYGITVFQSNVVYVIFDKVVIWLSVSDDRIDVGSTADISWSAVYAYDGQPFNGSIWLSNPLMIDEVGKYRYEVIEVEDRLYGLSFFESNYVDVIFDMVIVEIIVDRTYYLVGEEVELSINAFYSYDGVPFQGDIIINTPLVLDNVGEYIYKVDEIIDAKYGLEAFSSNEVNVIADNVSIKYSIDTSLPFYTKLILTVYSEYMGGNINASVFVNGDPIVPTPPENIFTKEIFSFNPINSLYVEVSYREVDIADIELSTVSYSTVATYIIALMGSIGIIIFKFKVFRK